MDGRIEVVRSWKVEGMRRCNVAVGPAVAVAGFLVDLSEDGLDKRLMRMHSQPPGMDVDDFAYAG